MAWIDTLQALTDQEAMVFLERTKKRMIAYRNTQTAGMTPVQIRVFDRDEFMPRMNRVMALLGARRNTLAAMTNYDAQITLTEV